MDPQGANETQVANTLMIPIEMDLSEAKLLEAFRRLSVKRRADLLDKLQTLREPILRTVSANTLYHLTALVSLGGDAVADAEALYDGNNGRLRWFVVNKV